MKLKNILLSGLSLVLVAALAIGGTVAYLQDDDSDVNVMTLGNVKIAQHEYERVVDENGNYTNITVDGVNSYELKEFTQGKPLLPIVGDPNGGYDPTEVRLAQLGHNSRGGMQVLNVKNVQDKFVVVENTGKNDAYVRTIVAFEAGSLSEEEFAAVVNYSSHFTWKETEDWFVTAIDGNNYYLVEFVYNGYEDVQHPNGVLTPGDFTYNSLAQVYLFNTATNEDCEALDGNKNGTFDILVLSQAVQTAGFADAKTALDAGFGEFNEANVQSWFGGMVIPVYGEDTEALEYVLNNGGKLFVEDDISTDQITVDNNTTVDIDLQENTLSGIVMNNGEMNVSDGKMEGTYIQNNGDATFTNVEMKAGSASDYASINSTGATTEYNEVNINSAGGGVGVVGGAKVVFNGGSVYVDSASTSGRYNFYATGEGSEITINDGTFSWNPAKNNKRAYIYADAGTTVIVNGGTFGQASTRSGYTAGILGSGTVIIKGGTFGFNPSAWVADGYEAVQSGSNWTVVAK